MRDDTGRRPPEEADFYHSAAWQLYQEQESGKNRAMAHEQETFSAFPEEEGQAFSEVTGEEEMLSWPSVVEPPLPEEMIPETETKKKQRQRRQKKSRQAASGQQTDAEPAKGLKNWWRRLPGARRNRLVLGGCIAGFLLATAACAWGMHVKFAADQAALHALVEEQMALVRAENEQTFTDLGQRLQEIEGQMEAVAAILEDTNASILSSGAENRQAMAERIEEMDEQLANLKESLNILMESKGK